jgi:hypothetical protein
VHFVVLQRGWYRAISMSCVTLPKWHGRGLGSIPIRSTNKSTTYDLPSFKLGVTWYQILKDTLRRHTLFLTASQ